MSVQVSYKKQITFWILFACIIVLVVEPIVRTYDYIFPNCTFLDSDVFENIKNEALKRDVCHSFYNLKWTDANHISYEPNQHFTVVNINDDGFRGPEISLEKEENVFRIFFLGGSTAFGATALSDMKTIPGYMQKLFDQVELEQRIEIINAGIPGGYSYIESKLISEKILEYNPDLLVIYDGYNDNYRSFDNYYFDTKETNSTRDLLQYILQNNFYKTPQFFYHQYFRAVFDSTELIVFDDSKKFEKSERWANTWRDVCSENESKGIKTIITLQPILGTGEKELTKEEKRNFDKYDGEKIIKNYEFFAKQLEELSDSCTKIVDLRNSFDNEIETMFYDSVHTGDEGNKIIAKKIFDSMKDII